MLISDHRAWLIDWAWPTLGAARTDPACWVLRLMASGGHTAHEAERQASRLAAFQAADPAHIDLFAVANVQLLTRSAEGVLVPAAASTAIPAAAAMVIPRVH